LATRHTGTPVQRILRQRLLTGWRVVANAISFHAGTEW
jgi:hypothetical protein